MNRISLKKYNQIWQQEGIWIILAVRCGMPGQAKWANWWDRMAVKLIGGRWCFVKLIKVRMSIFEIILRIILLSKLTGLILRTFERHCNNVEDGCKKLIVSVCSTRRYTLMVILYPSIISGINYTGYTWNFRSIESGRFSSLMKGWLHNVGSPGATNADFCDLYIP